MKNFSKKDFERLSKKQADVCISLYMPTHKYGPETQQGPIRLKNLIQRAANQLQEAGWSPIATEKIMQPLQEKVEDPYFWRHQREGLILFRSPEELIDYRLPIDCDETLVIAQRFHLKPLIPLLNRNTHFYVLALSLGQASLLKGNQYNLTEVDVPQMPNGIQDALKYDDPERQLQHQTLSRTGGGRPAIHHGHGDDYDPKENALRYSRMVAEQVEDVLKDEQAPLILAGAEHLLPIYQESSSYPHTIEDWIPANPERIDLDKIHKQALEIMQPLFDKQLKNAKSNYEYRKAQHTDQVSTDLNEIIPAAYYGRVDTLFVTQGIQTWGVFNPSENDIEIQPDPNLKNEDLLDFAAINAYLNGGNVFVVEAENAPNDSEISAVFRY